MPDTAKVKVVILWAEEVRIAARAMDTLFKALHKESTATAEEKDAALKYALSAAHAAFNSPELLGDCAIMVAESPIHAVMGAKRRAVVEIEEDAAPRGDAERAGDGK
jgi:hypothetical protein